MSLSYRKAQVSSVYVSVAQGPCGSGKVFVVVFWGHGLLGTNKVLFELSGLMSPHRGCSLYVCLKSCSKDEASTDFLPCYFVPLDV